MLRVEVRMSSVERLTPVVLDTDIVDDAGIIAFQDNQAVPVVFHGRPLFPVVAEPDELACAVDCDEVLTV